MATLEHQLATITQGCSDAVHTLDSDMQNITNGDTTYNQTIGQDGQNGYQTCKAASTALDALHLSTALHPYRLVQQLLVEEHSFTDGALIAGSLFNSSVEQNNAQIFYEAIGELSGAEQHRTAAQALLSKINKSFGI